jgi:hypothetical protein
MKTLLALLVLLSGCAAFNTDIEGVGHMGTYTEAYTAFHNVPVKAHPTTPVEWQAKANDECREALMQWRLPDSNFGWKHSKEMTMCVFSFAQNTCLCQGPPPVNAYEAHMLNEIRWSTMPEPTAESIRLRKLAKQLEAKLAHH